MTTTLHPGGFKPEIQGLRAIAVVLVLVFHIWPAAMTGGYVGVDVFFVISGYLITDLLLRQAEKTGRISVAKFYARRIKRLLPAATVVLLAVATCISILPLVRWQGTAYEIVASALYVENWWLAKNAVDYLAMESAPSPLQHYWSLSIEEQYYIVWPLLLALFTWLAPSFRGRPRLVFGTLVVAIGCASLAYSIYITPRNPGLAYFATTTRSWELAIGGALAVFTGWQRMSGGLRLIAGYLGVAAIMTAALTFDTTTSFPGYHALMPTLGAALVIASGAATSPWAVYTALKSRPFQYFGDISYSLYLWHWPVVIFYAALAGREIGLVDGVIVLVISTALAHQTKQLVEDRFRKPEFAAQGPRMPFAFGALCIASVVFSAYFVINQVSLRSTPQQLVAGSADDHPGALSLTLARGFDSVVPYTPTVLTAVDDKGDAYRDGCIASLAQAQVRQCRYGVKGSAKHMIVVGDSHAVHWIPTLAKIAERQGWVLTAITKSACPFAILGTPPGLDEKLQSCIEWNQAAMKEILAYAPQVVVFAHSESSMSAMAPTKPEGRRLVADGIVAAWRKLEENGARIIAIQDTPKFKTSPPDCMSAAGATVEGCSRPRSEAMGFVDPLVLASRKHPGALLVDMTDAICDRDYCAPVVGNVFVWRDTHHLTATYARSLADPLQKAIAPVLGAAAKP